MKKSVTKMVALLFSLAVLSITTWQLASTLYIMENGEEAPVSDTAIVIYTVVRTAKI